MSLVSFIERLREKPKDMRVQVSFLGALCVTGMIGVLWGVTLPARLGNLPNDDIGTEAQNASAMHSFFENAKSSLAELIGGTTEVTRDVPEGDVFDVPPSGAYRVGAPEGETDSTSYQPYAKPEPVVTPVSRREIRIATTTSGQQRQ